MLVELQKTVNEWNNRSHLLPFLKKAPTVICIKSEDEVFFIHINKGNVELLLEGNHHIDAQIQGRKEYLVPLLHGEFKLRQATLSKVITLQASFRTTLYLETLFFLVKPYKHVSNL
jgi:putative sterol carrier protein